jgi:hypothetical protein
MIFEDILVMPTSMTTARSSWLLRKFLSIDSCRKSELKKIFIEIFESCSVFGTPKKASQNSSLYLLSLNKLEMPSKLIAERNIGFSAIFAVG